MIDVKSFGAVGDGVTDDTKSIRAALAASNEVHFPAGVYVLTDGIELPESAILTGSGSPVLGTFPLRDDDKRFLTDEKLADLPGTTLLFRGRGTRSSTTDRADEFANYRYAVKTAAGLPYKIRGLAIVLDVRVLDAANQMTVPGHDRRADYDVGLAVDDSPGGRLDDVSVFGYWNKAGLCVVSRGHRSNPDYNTFYGCNFSGQYGVALLGTDDKVGKGLSGTQFYGCNLFSADHHSRRPPWGSGALLIDGQTMGKRADINGHYFFGGCIRTYNNLAVRLDHASNVCFNSVVFEVPSWDRAGSEGADTTGKIVGTENTRDVTLVGCRMHDIGLRELANSMTDGNVTVVGGTTHGVSVASGGQTVKLHASASGDPLIQLTTDSSSLNNGWTIRSDVSDNQSLVLRHNNRAALTLRPDGTLQSASITAKSLSVGSAKEVVVREGIIEVSQTRIAIRCPSPTTLDGLRGGDEGDVVILELADGSSAVTIPAADGDMLVSRPMVLDHKGDRFMLIKSGSQWIELSRTDFSP